MLREFEYLLAGVIVASHSSILFEIGSKAFLRLIAIKSEIGVLGVRAKLRAGCDYLFSTILPIKMSSLPVCIL